jgi:hypothetical protein
MAAVVALGADPQHVGFDERDQGLADGSIIGFDNGVAFQADRLDVLTHLVADVPFTTRMSALVAGPAAELNADERRWIAEAVADTAARTAELGEVDREAAAEACAVGDPGYALAGPEGIAAFEAALAPVEAEVAAQPGNAATLEALHELVAGIPAETPVTCEGLAESSGATTPDTTLPSTGEGPVGVIAIGHSGLTGENSDPARPFQPALENSWATGTNPEVNSIYMRLVAARPENEGHVANTAEGGAPASRLAGQAESAMSTVPTPQLVIIQTIDGDLQCPLDEFALAAFGETLADVLDQIVTASPESQILIVGQWGRPIAAEVDEFVAAHPEVLPALTGPGENCNGFFDPSGALVQETFDLLNASISAYEGEQQRRCGAVPQCRTDGGVRANYTQVEEEVSSDGNHLNVHGQASAAELVWPVVVEMLGLDGATASSAVSSTELES